MTAESPETSSHHRDGPPWRRATPPPWWPDDEPWPPQRAPWKINRSRVFIRLFLFLGLFILVLTLIGWGIATLFHGGWSGNGGGWGDDEGNGPPFFAPLIGLAIIGGITWFVGRRIRRSVEPLVDVVEAAERVAEGTYQVRVTPAGPREVRRLMLAFNAMAERLDVNEEQRRRFFADIAHELRTPLSIIQGNIEGMLDGVYPRDDAHLTPLLDETRMIARLLNDLQLLATAEAGMLHLDRALTDIDTILEDAAATFRPKATENDITIKVIASAFEADVDETRLRQVIDNLIANALRYTPSGGEIRLEMEIAAKQLIIRVRDNGRGMTEEVAPHIFERFVKSADSGGSGLGLAIARGIIEAHGGTIGATSSIGQGTTIEISLPR